MSGLMKQVEQRRQLPKAGDADRDPADLTASRRAGETTGEPASKTASVSASRNAGSTAAESAGSSAAVPAVRSASRKAVKKASSGDRQRPAGRKPRRVGRPLGPSRTAITVRILSEIDDALTAAVEDSGQSPQYIVDDALRAWLTQHGYLRHV